MGSMQLDAGEQQQLKHIKPDNLYDMLFNSVG
jgi:hypothetical protein